MTDLATIVALREASDAAWDAVRDTASAFESAINDALTTDFPRATPKHYGQRAWYVGRDVALYLWFGRDHDRAFAWESEIRVLGLRRSRGSGPTPYAAVCAALEALDDTEARDALRAAVEATR